MWSQLVYANSAGIPLRCHVCQWLCHCSLVNQRRAAGVNALKAAGNVWVERGGVRLAACIERRLLRLAEGTYQAVMRQSSRHSYQRLLQLGGRSCTQRQWCAVPQLVECGEQAICVDGQRRMVHQALRQRGRWTAACCIPAALAACRRRCCRVAGLPAAGRQAAACRPLVRLQQAGKRVGGGGNRLQVMRDNNTAALKG